MRDIQISRRAVLAGTAASALGLSARPARAEVNWKKYAGTKLEVILAKGPRGDNLQKYIKEFTDLTGIQVESEQIPEQQQRQKAVIELASGKPSFDVIHLSYHVQKRQFEKAGWLADVTPFMKDPSLTAPDLTESDRGDEILRPFQQVLTSRRRGLQLDGVARLLRARARRDVDRRRRLGPGRGKSELLACRRQGRLCDGAGWAEGPVLGHLWRW